MLLLSRLCWHSYCKYICRLHSQLKLKVTRAIRFEQEEYSFNQEKGVCFHLTVVRAEVTKLNDVCEGSVIHIIPPFHRGRRVPGHWPESKFVTSGHGTSDLLVIWVSAQTDEFRSSKIVRWQKFNGFKIRHRTFAQMKFPAYGGLPTDCAEHLPLIPITHRPRTCYTPMWCCRATDDKTNRWFADL